jgi:hypothetical protein
MERGRRRRTIPVPRRRRRHGGRAMHISLTPLLALIAGILILIMPKLLNYIVAIYLIIIGLVGLFGGGTLRL